MHFSATNAAFGRGRSQSIVALENVNGMSLKRTPLPDESDYRITDVEAGKASLSILPGARLRAKYWQVSTTLAIGERRVDALRARGHSFCHKDARFHSILSCQSAIWFTKVDCVTSKQIIWRFLTVSRPCIYKNTSLSSVLLSDCKFVSNFWNVRCKIL